jgi:hypothetical protein
MAALCRAPRSRIAAPQRRTTCWCLAGIVVSPSISGSAPILTGRRENSLIAPDHGVRPREFQLESLARGTNGKL